MVVVRTADATTISFSEATGVSTDEHNNLQIFAGVDTPRLVQIFNRHVWSEVEIDYGQNDQDSSL